MKYTKGFTLVEIIISTAIIALMAGALGAFQTNVFTFNYFLQGSLNAQLDARRVVKVMVTEIRKASQSEEGSYPIDLASSTAITFYSDADGNGVKDKIRYFISGSDLKRGIIVPSGSPLRYTASEQVSTLISGVVASSTLPLFQYYPSSYTGTTSPLSQPVNVNTVRLVKITVIIDKDPIKSPAQMIVTSQVNIRNLKDNL